MRGAYGVHHLLEYVHLSATGYGEVSAHACVTSDNLTGHADKAAENEEVRAQKSCRTHERLSCVCINFVAWNACACRWNDNRMLRAGCACGHPLSLTGLTPRPRARRVPAAPTLRTLTTSRICLRARRGLP